jgi:predicted PurR-regulated permease PerM
MGTQLITPAISQVTDLAKNLPKYVLHAEDKVESSIKYIKKKVPALDKIKSKKVNETKSPTNTDEATTGTNLTTIANSITDNNTVRETELVNQTVATETSESTQNITNNISNEPSNSVTATNEETNINSEEIAGALPGNESVIAVTNENTDTTIPENDIVTTETTEQTPATKIKKETHKVSVPEIIATKHIKETLPDKTTLKKEPEATKEVYSPVKKQFTAIDFALQFKDSIMRFVQANAQGALSNVFTVAAGTVTGIGYLITILVLSFYFLMDGKHLVKGINSLIPKKFLPNAMKIEQSIHESLLGFLKGQVYLGILAGAIMLPVYLAFGIKYALFLCIFLTVAEIIPVVGSTLGFIPAIIIILFTDPMKLILICIIFWIMQAIKDNIVAPKIVGEIIGLHPVTVILSLWIGFQLAGLFGIIFAIPVASVINVIISFIIQEKTVIDAKTEE